MKYNLYILVQLYPCQIILSTIINVWLVVKYSISAVFLSLAVNQYMWEAVLTFNHLTRIHIVYIKLTSSANKNTQDKETNLMFWTQSLKEKKKRHRKDKQ